MITNSPTIWWTQITGPRRLVDVISATLRNSRSVIYISNPDMPWRHEMRYTVEEQIRNTGSFVVDYIDWEDEHNREDIGRFLLERYASNNDMAAYRPHLGKPGPYLHKLGVLSKRVIWIKGIPADQVGEWVSFCRDYRTDTKEHGVFVIEAAGYNPLIRFPKYISVIRYFDYVSPYDTQLFALIVLSRSNIPVCFHQYISYVTANLCLTDGELVAELISNTDFEKSSPLESLEKLYDEDQILINRGSTKLTDSEPHPFQLLRNNSIQVLNNRLWKAQLQAVFPLVEEERISFIQKYEEAVKACLPIRQYTQIITNPYDVELGTLVYLTQEKDENDQRRLYIPESTDYKRLHFLRDIRHKLAHMRICTPEEMTDLLGENKIGEV